MLQSASCGVGVVLVLNRQRALSYTHSEPRIELIFSELLQTDRRTDRWVDRQMCTHRQEREDQMGHEEDDRKHDPESTVNLFSLFLTVLS